jgi:hypothetical protein
MPENIGSFIRLQHPLPETLILDKIFGRKIFIGHFLFGLSPGKEQKEKNLSSSRGLFCNIYF